MEINQDMLSRRAEISETEKDTAVAVSLDICMLFIQFSRDEKFAVKQAAFLYSHEDEYFIFVLLKKKCYVTIILLCSTFVNWTVFTKKYGDFWSNLKFFAKIVRNSKIF